MKRKNGTSKKRKSLLVSAVVSAIFLSSTTIAFGQAYVQTWDLVDSGKHLDYDYSTKYSSNLTTAVGKWEGYKNGIIRPDSIYVVEDVFISDYYEVSNTNGVTSSAGTIKLNTYQLDAQGSTQTTRVITHELGHALGLDHSTSSDIMYEYTIITSSLTQNDKDSYNAAYNNY